jgi:PAS domain S-box-containing protein
MHLNERHLRLIMNQAPVLIAFCDKRRRYRFANREYAESFGLSPEEIIGRNVAEVMGENAYARIRDHLDAALQGKSVEFDFTLASPKLGTRFMHCTYAPEILKDGTVGGVVAVIHDVTDHHRIQQQLSGFRAISDSAHDVCFCVDVADGRLTYVNRSATLQLGYAEDELVKMHFTDILEGLPSDFLTTCLECLASKKPIAPPEALLKRKDGKLVPVEITFTGLDWEGRPHLCGIARDISERKLAEESLRVSRERLDLVVQSIGLGLWYCDLPLDRLVWNDRCKEHFWVPADAEVTINTFFERLHPDDRERTRQAIERSIQTGAPFDIDYRTVAPDGRERWIRAIGRCFFDAQGQPRRFDGVTVDTTERKRIEESLREADRRKDEFLALLSHELRNPLTAVRNAVRLLDFVSVSDPTFQETRAVLDRQTQLLAGLVDDLLDVFRITHQKIVLAMEPLDLSELVRVTIGDLQSALANHGLTVVHQLPEIAVWVQGDRIRLAQVLMNLLNNAAKFTNAGGRITVRLVVDLPRQRAVVKVQDSGIGIDPKDLPRIFDTFTQGARELARDRGGLGLGLALVKGLVEMHRGEVSATSAGIGKGAELSFWLALSAPPDKKEQRERPIRSVSRRLRILLVEDNLDTVRTLAVLLRRYGHEVEVAHTGVEGVHKAVAWKPGVVLCDLGLPEMDGYQVAHHLRSRPDTADIRLIAVSGYGLEEDRRRSEEAGFDLHLTKPVDPLDLQRLLSIIKVGN